MFQRATVPKPPPTEEEVFLHMVADLKATPVEPRTPEQIEARDKAAYELRMQKHRIEQAKAQVEAQRAKEAADRSAEAAKNITDAESYQRWMQQHFCPLVQSKRF